ncbi:MAG: ABC transporter ATP-binding protein [Planctomycetes bacterium]|nr:ABC transporter ATP-binding protein [Planctomycetota bacterium]
MRNFLLFSLQMFRYPGRLLAALILAFFSAFSVGSAMLALRPVLENVFYAQPGSAVRDLPVLAAEMNERLHKLPWGLGKTVQIPKSIIDSLPTGAYSTALWIFIGLGVLTVLGATSTFLHSYLTQTLVNRVLTNVRRDTFRQVLKRPLKDVITAGPSDMISRVVYDTSTMSGALLSVIGKGLGEASKAIAAVVVALVVDWRLSVIAVVAGGVIGVVIRQLSRKIKKGSRGALERQSDLYRVATESLQGLRVVKVHTAERAEVGRFHKANKQMLRELNRVRTARALASPLVEAIAIIALGTLALIAIKAMIDKVLDPSSFLVALAALGVAGGSLKPLTGIITDIQAGTAAADRLAELRGSLPEPGHGFRLAKLPRHKRSIEFQDVTFSYPNQNRPAVDGVTLNIAHGETVAFVGPNGCGKTSLLSLVPRLFEPEKGNILIDGLNIRDFSVRSVRRQIGVVTQETVLFSGTIRQNIAYGSPDASEDEIVEAARKARALEFIRRLPQGFDTAVAEQGLSLSGGQRQRIAIARAILRDPAILILDEATSMIDAESESKISEAITDFSRGRTCLIVAHRLSTVVQADRIVVMDYGKVADIGRHHELLGRCEIYQRLVRTQLVGTEYTTS